MERMFDCHWCNMICNVETDEGTPDIHLGYYEAKGAKKRDGEVGHILACYPDLHQELDDEERRELEYAMQRMAGDNREEWGWTYSLWKREHQYAEHPRIILVLLTDIGGPVKAYLTEPSKQYKGGD